MEYRELTDIGKIRQQNEDYFFASSKSVGKLPNLFIVADGMGGHNAGEVASRMCVESIVDYAKVANEEDPVKILQNSLKIANSNIRSTSLADADKMGMGTTVVACTIFPDYAYILNVGDSRLYICSDDITQVTKDHTLVGEMLRMGSISKPAAKRHPKRHMLTRAVGIYDTVEADYFKISYKKNDKILMTTDGLTNMVDDEELFGVISGSSSIDTKVSVLKDTALKNGGEDNITFILVEL